MKPRCLTTSRMSMEATLLHQYNDYAPPEGDINLDNYGEWQQSQDPLTGQIISVWVPYDEEDITNPDTGDTVDVGTVRCLARGIVDGGIRVAGTTERFGDTYENIDYVKLWLPANVHISKRDRVTNIKDASGHIRWLDEEFSDPRTTEVPRATVFNVNGVTPLFDAFNRHVENFALLERASVHEEVTV